MQTKWIEDAPIFQATAAFIENLQSRGRCTFTRAEALKADKRSSAALTAALRRLRHKGRIANPRRGFYLIIPAEYREAGCPPANRFIDDPMKFLGQPYGVGILSAAAIHGAAHQQPMLFQVITDRPTRAARTGLVRIASSPGSSSGSETPSPLSGLSSPSMESDPSGSAVPAGALEDGRGTPAALMPGLKPRATSKESVSNWPFTTSEEDWKWIPASRHGP